MRYAFVIALLCLFACCTPKSYQGQTYASTLDYMDEYSRLTVDTTFAYELINKSTTKIKNSVVLPDSLGGSKISGIIKFYSLINDNKNLTDIDFINVELFKAGKPYFFFNNGENKKGSVDYSKMLKSYILEVVKSYPFKTNVVPSKGLHKTYCLITVP